MTDDREKWKKAKEIFNAASELPPGSRDAFIDSVSGGNTAIRDEVRRMFEVESEIGDFIETPAASLAESLGAPPGREGRTIGNYRIVREIGRGGMGAVYLAERTVGGFEQTVALKLVGRASGDGELARRFKQEREILSSLNHPNIARLLDGGISPDGELYLAMEYVPGKNLADHLGPVRIEERLRTFLKVCAAVAYAHENLVVHRDIKPSNIVVGPDGEPKLLDFGLARITDAAGEVSGEKTRTAFRAFTPAYASPEQILGRRVTTASDVYSLGVVFYELICGARPFEFDGMDLEQMIRTLTNGEPKPPSLVIGGSGPDAARADRRPKPDRDLDTIALKALQREPSQRYRTVNEFADDIERFLGGLPVKARPATFGYRAYKFVSRNFWTVSAVSLALISVLAGFAISVWQYSAANRERVRAEGRFNDVRKLSTSLLFEITPRIERLEGSIEAREITVQRALEYLDSLAREADDDRGLRVELANAYLRIGEIQGNSSKPNLGDFAGAVASLEKARELISGLSPSPETLEIEAEIYRSLAKSRQGDTDRSIGDSGRAIGLYRRLAESDGRSDAYAVLELETIAELAQIHTSNSDFKSALATIEQATERIARLDGANPRVRELTVMFAVQKGFALSWESRQAEAEAEMERAVVAAERLAAEFPADTRVRKVLWEAYYRTSAIFETIDDRKSLGFAERSVLVKLRDVESDPADTQARQDLARSHSRVGLALANLKRIGPAIDAWRKAEAILKGLSASQPKSTGYRADLATLYFRIGRAEFGRSNNVAARGDLERALALYEGLFAADPKNVNAERHIGLTSQILGSVFDRSGDRDRSRALFERALAVFEGLDARGALPKYDLKHISELRSKLGVPAA